MAQLLYQGHGSFRITAQNGTVIYVDPFAGEEYDCPADLILVTHEHSDHNRIEQVAKKPQTCIIRAADAFKGGSHQSFIVGGIIVEAVDAYNKNHRKDECVGFLITVDHKTVYAAGDTSQTEQMSLLHKRNLDWALLPIDGVYNMAAAEASRCAAVIGAKHVIPIHMKPGSLFDQSIAETFQASGRVIVRPGETILL